MYEPMYTAFDVHKIGIWAILKKKKLKKSTSVLKTGKIKLLQKFFFKHFLFVKISKVMDPQML